MEQQQFFVDDTIGLKSLNNSKQLILRFSLILTRAFNSKLELYILVLILELSLFQLTLTDDVQGCSCSHPHPVAR